MCIMCIDTPAHLHPSLSISLYIVVIIFFILFYIYQTRVVYKSVMGRTRVILDSAAPVGCSRVLTTFMVYKCTGFISPRGTNISYNNTITFLLFTWFYHTMHETRPTRYTKQQI